MQLREWQKICLLLIIPLLLTVMFRMYSSDLTIMGDCDSSADKLFIKYNPTRSIRECYGVNSVYVTMQNDISNQVRQQYPNLPPEKIQGIIDSKTEEAISQNNVQFKEKSKQTGEYIQSFFRDENGYTYLGDIDSYVWLRQADNIVKNGHVGDRLVNGTPYNDLVLAPFGSFDNGNFHSYAIATVYSFLKPFEPKMTIMRASFYVPIIFGLLSAIIAFFLVRKLSGNFAGFIASMLVAVHPFFLRRSYGSDTDVYNVFFPLLITWILLEAMSEESYTKKVFLYSLTGISIGLFSYAWSGWWYIFDFIMLAFLALIVYTFFKNKNSSEINKTKPWMILTISLIPLLFFSMVSVSYYQSFDAFLSSPTVPFSFVTKSTLSGDSIWPNVYTTVAELNPSSLNDVIANMGGNYFVALSLLGLFGSLIFCLMKDLKSKEDKSTQIYFATFFIMWFFATIYASLQGVRFVLLNVPVFAIGVGILAGFLFNEISEWLGNITNLSSWAFKSFMVLFFIWIIFFASFGPVQIADRVSRQNLPLIDDAWYNALIKINKESDKNAIVTSWWDFGHQFKFISGRKVTFDGGTQSTPQAYWVGKALLTSDERESVGILRMLDCGANQGYELLKKELEDDALPVTVLGSIVKKDVLEARKELQELGIDEQKANQVLEMTHCEGKDLPESYFITSGDLVGKSGVWAHFGSWNFIKANMYNQRSNWSIEDAVLFGQKNGLSEDDSKKLYFESQAISDGGVANTWIAPWPSYQGMMSCITSNNETVCENAQGRIILQKGTAYAYTDQGFLPVSTFVTVKDGYYLVHKENSSIALGVTYVGNTLILSSPEIAESMFNRLYYLDGAEMEDFQKFTEQNNPVNNNLIKVWKVNLKNEGVN